MNKTLLKPLPKAKKVYFRWFVRTDLRNRTSKKYCNDFLNIIWFETIFKPIRIINRTDSHAIWTRLGGDIDHFETVPRICPPKKKNSHVLPKRSTSVDQILESDRGMSQLSMAIFIVSRTHLGAENGH